MTRYTKATFAAGLPPLFSAVPQLSLGVAMDRVHDDPLSWHINSSDPTSHLAGWSNRGEVDHGTTDRSLRRYSGRFLRLLLGGVGVVLMVGIERLRWPVRDILALLIAGSPSPALRGYGSVEA